MFTSKKIIKYSFVIIIYFEMCSVTIFSCYGFVMDHAQVKLTCHKSLMLFL